MKTSDGKDFVFPSKDVYEQVVERIAKLKPEGFSVKANTEKPLWDLPEFAGPRDAIIREHGRPLAEAIRDAAPGRRGLTLGSPGEVGGAVVGAGAGEATINDDDSPLERMGKVVGGAALGVGGVRSLRNLKRVTPKDLAATVADETALSKPVPDAATHKTPPALEDGTPRDSYTQGLLKETVGTPKDDELLITPAFLKTDPTGKEWAEEMGRTVAKRMTVSDEIVDDFAKYWTDTKDLLSGKKLAPRPRNCAASPTSSTPTRTSPSFK